MASSGLDVSTIHQIQRALIFLKNRNQLLKRNIRELKYRNANALQMFTDMYVMDKELSDLLKETYESDVDINAILNQFVEVCKTRAKINIEKRQKQLQKELKEKREWEEAMRDSMERSRDQVMDDLAFLAGVAVDVVESIAHPFHDHHHHHEFMGGPPPGPLPEFQQDQDLHAPHGNERAQYETPTYNTTPEPSFDAENTDDGLDTTL